MGSATLQQSAGIETLADDEPDNTFRTTSDVIVTWMAVAALGGMYRATSSIDCSHVSVVSFTTNPPQSSHTYAWWARRQHGERRQHLKANDAAYPSSLVHLGLVSGLFARDV
jgi:hypothetical protein